MRYSEHKPPGDAMQIRPYQETDRPFLRTLYLASRKAVAVKVASAACSSALPTPRGG